jgi:hypothetical protein
VGFNPLLHFFWKLMRRNVGILQWERTETKCDLQDYLQALTCVDWVPIRPSSSYQHHQSRNVNSPVCFYPFLRDAFWQWNEIVLQAPPELAVRACMTISKVKQRLDVSCAVLERVAHTLPPQYRSSGETR